MPKKVKRPFQKQKQLQQVIVNVGDVKRKRVRRKRKTRRRASNEAAAQEYSQAISQIIPRIQYNMPAHTNFNFDPPPNLVPQTKPNDITNSIPIMIDKTKNERTNITETGNEFPKSQFTEPKPQPDLLPLKKPEPDAVSKTIPIDKPDKEVSMVEGLTDQITHEKKVLAKQSRTRKPNPATVKYLLNTQGLPDTEENKEKIIGDWLRDRAHGLTAKEITNKYKKEDKENIKLEGLGVVSRLASRPEEVKKKLVKPKINLKKKEVNLYMDKPKESTLPIMENEVVSSL